MSKNRKKLFHWANTRGCRLEKFLVHPRNFMVKFQKFRKIIKNYKNFKKVKIQISKKLSFKNAIKSKNRGDIELNLLGN